MKGKIFSNLRAQFGDIGMNRVLPGLYIGSYRDSMDSQQLRIHRITHILSLRSYPKRIVMKPYYMHIPIADTTNENIARYFGCCNDFIHRARLSDRDNNVLVHCHAGVSRSATIVAAYLMTVTYLDWQEALQVLCTVRPVVKPNKAFRRQLRWFQLLAIKNERDRLYKKFSTNELLSWDYMRTRALLEYEDCTDIEGDDSDSE